MPHPKDLYIYVHSPLTERTADETYTSYAIFLMTKFPNFEKKMSHTRRRYREFHALRNLLCKRHPRVRFPVFPPKCFPCNRLNENTIVTRMQGFQHFLNEAVKYDEIIQDKLFQQFLQSSLSIQELVKEFPEYVVDDAIQQWFRDSAPSAIHTSGRPDRRTRASPGPRTSARPDSRPSARPDLSAIAMLGSDAALSHRPILWSSEMIFEMDDVE